MTFAIAGVTGNTGKVAANTLLDRGEKVRVIVRDAAKGKPWKERGAEVAVAELDDARSLTDALRGARGAYLLVPPNHAAPKFRDFQDRVSAALAAAVEDSGVPHVALLSSVGAQHQRGTGPIAGLHETERKLDATGAAISKIRAGYFVENFGASLGPVKESGVLPSFFPAALAFPMVSTRDIGRLAAQLLVDPPPQSQVLELGSDHSNADVAAALAKILDKPVTVQEAPISLVVPTFTGFGFTPDLAELYAEMIAGVASGLVAFEGGHKRVSSTESLEQALRALVG